MNWTVERKNSFVTSETSVKLRWPGLEAFTAPLFDGEKKEKL